MNATSTPSDRTASSVKAVDHDLPSARILSVNVALPQSDPGGADRLTGIDKRPQDFIDVFAPGPHYGDGSGVHGDFVGDTKHHGGADKAVYAFAREELDFWQSELGRPVASGAFGDNLTTAGIDWATVVIGQRVSVGTAELEVSVPRQPCRAFGAWLEQRGWMKAFTHRANPGSYLRVIAPGRIRPGDAVQFGPAPDHGITMRETFLAKMGDNDLALRVLEAACLPEHHLEQLRKRLS